MPSDYSRTEAKLRALAAQREADRWIDCSTPGCRLAQGHDGLHRFVPEVERLRAEIERLTRELRRYIGPAVGNEPVAERDVLLALIEEGQAREEALRGALWRCRAGDGCLCSGGPYSVSYPHSARCREWQDALDSAHRAALTGAPPLAPWYEADGSTVMLPVEEVERRRRAAAKVIGAARAWRHAMCGVGPERAARGLKERGTELVAALRDLDAASHPGADPETNPAAKEE